MSACLSACQQVMQKHKRNISEVYCLVLQIALSLLDGQKWPKLIENCVTLHCGETEALQDFFSEEFTTVHSVFPSTAKGPYWLRQQLVPGDLMGTS